MSNRLTDWLRGRKTDTQVIELEDVTPQHPDEYPARHLKEILDGRRSRFSGRASEPTGMPDGPGATT